VRCGGCEEELASVAEQPLNDTRSQQNHHKRGAEIGNGKMDVIFQIFIQNKRVFCVHPGKCSRQSDATCRWAAAFAKAFSKNYLVHDWHQAVTCVCKTRRRNATHLRVSGPVISLKAPNLETNVTIVKSRGRHAHFFHNGHYLCRNNMIALTL
jgi:hypothetical protein